MNRSLPIVSICLALAQPLPAVTPLIADVADQIIPQGSDTGVLHFVVGDTETPFSALTVAASSGNPALVPENSANLVIGGANSQRTVTVIPTSGLTGSSAITLTVTDGEGLTASSVFNLTVTPPNTPPAISGLAGYQIVSPGESPAALDFTVTHVETASLTVTASSSNASLVPDGNLAITGSGSNRTLRITPAAGQLGTAVIKLITTDESGASARQELTFSVFDPACANNSFKQPRGLYVLDSAAGTQIGGISMRDTNIRDVPFVDGYVLRTDWGMLEPSDGVFNFSIIDNIFAKLPAHQKLSFIIFNNTLPSWLNSLPGITTYTAGNPAVTRPFPWDAIAQERYRQLIAALGNHVVDGVPFRTHPRLAAINTGIPGLFGGVRDPTEIKIRDMAGYSRANMESAILAHLGSATDNFPDVPVQLGFWTYTDATATPAPWEDLREAVLARHDGTLHPRVGFWMENLAAFRAAADADPWTGLPTTTYAAPLHLSQNRTFTGYQMLGSWARPFSASHVDNNLNGTPEDAMEYAFNTFQTRYHEVYVADVDFAPFAAEFQRWHDFLAALPAPPPLILTNGQGGVSMAAANGTPVDFALNATGGTGPYTWIPVSGAIPDGITLSSGGVLTGSSTEGGVHYFTVRATDANGATATREFSLAVEFGLRPFTATPTRHPDGTFTLEWPAVTGGWYQVETSVDLVKWTLLGNSVKATSGSMTWTDDGSLTGTHPAAGTKRFYRVRDWGVFDVAFTSNRFTYTDSQRTVTGLFQKPALAGRLPALVINHGTGGTTLPGGFTDRRAQEMSPWGLFCIGPDLTHTQGAAVDLETFGYSSENLARDLACVAVLATRGDVDLNRLAMWGHSRGSFTSIGVASVLGDRLHALGFSAGGVVDDGGQEISFPSVSEAAGITAPTVMFHGSTDNVVDPATSLHLQTLLQGQGIPNNRIIYDTTAITGGNQHSIQNVPAINTDMLANWRAWMVTHGVLP